ncbi:M48 family metallopeptidase [Sphingobium lignivorans]|uniref:Zn-dependent protease with chaperone function n=1 Tax=Sphingobium lignivorans TaxID=2735886 RepID=A0ABR6NAQ2_9SPHN|nr:M48 family metallopeptidase [Sphingobium lignivorans]MBB5984141.1 Zn-dependent protease with chaperone function [Sphingobium lignivorans]
MTSAGPDERIWHYDGQDATRHHPRIDWHAEGFSLVWPGGTSGPHRWSDLVPQGNAGGRSVYGLRGQGGWRLVFAGLPPHDFAVHLPLPARYGRWIDRIGLWPAIGLFALIAAILLFVVLRAPAWVAPLIPRSWEDRLGDTMIGDFGGRLCETPESRAALEKLRRELGDAVPIRRIAIANIKMVNAVALPGGHIIIFRDLIEEAKSPDELAGVLAHEIGHVRNRDTMTALVRQLGLSVLLGGFNGQVGGTINGLLALSYGRDAEREADRYSIEALRAADISPLPTAAFFERMEKRSGGESIERAMSWMASHPVSAERKAAFEDSAVKGGHYKPALSAAEWKALVDACAHDKDVAPPPFDF